jgi:hypothetical protein
VAEFWNPTQAAEAKIEAERARIAAAHIPDDPFEWRGDPA